eukprot:364745-Chlamydomonas_euryale.AAC.8
MLSKTRDGSWAATTPPGGRRVEIGARIRPGQRDLTVRPGGREDRCEDGLHGRARAVKRDFQDSPGFPEELAQSLKATGSQGVLLSCA